jgi:hypothetical protein
MNPQTDLPIGAMRCILVVADPDQEVREFAEYDNVTNTNVCFQRQ